MGVKENENWTNTYVFPGLCVALLWEDIFGIDVCQADDDLIAVTTEKHGQQMLGECIIYTMRDDEGTKVSLPHIEPIATCLSCCSES